MRRRSRECALQILYQMDVARELDPDPNGEANAVAVSAALAAYWGNFDRDQESKMPVDREFAERLVRGVASAVDALDAAIAGISQNWRVDRMEKVDRNLLRLAAYEILRCPDIPRAASINEAVEIAKRFSGVDSAAFINGLLDRLRAPPEGDAA